MIKFKKKTLLIGLLVLLLIGACAYTMSSIFTKAKDIPAVSDADRPAPTYAANKDKPLSSFKSKQDISDMVDSRVGKRDGTNVRSIELKTYKEYTVQDIPNNPGENFYVDNNRMVWVVTIDYPNGLTAKNGRYSKATAITVFDAETVTPLETAIFGDLVEPALRP